ncbi:helix-turn-helix domain-containing protein [Gelidibacter pelagius]|uniref:Helix-turn-helix transcriptional regulator n=1 Tax=Gelidibacter pelagius TaxID=2819985 RepID=A0ABS3SPG7_9FLAO|nr:helix-turn-helix transcriptional regulator [Gelidibacter pelagius]MBO3097600.1 helix-turn-helix transcriptional regulator [Gelidibacter pelagius]
MSINNIKSRLKNSSKQDNTWIERAKYRKENKAWLDISFAIAVKIMSAIKANKTSNIFPKTQKELAEAMNCSPQYVNKLLKGTENLQLETIVKIEQILNVHLIEVPEFQTTIQVQVEQYSSYTKPDELVSVASSLSNYDELFSSFSYESGPDNCLKLVA